MSEKHLWETDHPFYAAGGHINKYGSFDEFLKDWEDNDDDMNLLYRWDWKPKTSDENDISIHPEDPYYRDYTLEFTFILQRKSIFITCRVDVCQKDEAKVIEYLTKKWNYLKILWEGIS